MSDTPEIRPALSVEEWAALKAVRPGTDGLDYVKVGNGWVVEGFTDDGEEFDCGEVGYDYPPTRHAIAALALHEHPAGFTWEDVDRVRSRADDLEALRDNEGDDSSLYEEERTWRNLADRIAALLPPREEG